MLLSPAVSVTAPTSFFRADFIIPQMFAKIKNNGIILFMTRKRIILHIVAPKTGSTALQVFLTENRKRLEERGIGYYPRLHRYNPYHGFMNGDFLLARVFISGSLPDPELSPWMQKERDAYVHRRLKHCLSDETKHFTRYLDSCHTVILSDEILWHYEIFFPDFWLIIRDFITQCCTEPPVIDIVLHLRRQDEWVLAKFKEDMRNSVPHPLSFDEALAEYERIGYTDYAACVRRLSDVFGAEHIIVRPYDRSRFQGGEIASDFFHACGLDYSGLTPRSVQANPSNTLEATYALSLINKDLVARSRKKGRMVYYAASRMYCEQHPEPERTHAMTRQQRQELLNRYADGNQWISREFLSGETLFDGEIDHPLVVLPDAARDQQIAGEIRRLLPAAQKRILKRRMRMRYRRLKRRIYSLIYPSRT